MQSETVISYLLRKMREHQIIERGSSQEFSFRELQGQNPVLTGGENTSVKMFTPDFQDILNSKSKSVVSKDFKQSKVTNLCEHTPSDVDTVIYPQDYLDDDDEDDDSNYCQHECYPPNNHASDCPKSLNMGLDLTPTKNASVKIDRAKLRPLAVRPTRKSLKSSQKDVFDCKMCHRRFSSKPGLYHHNLIHEDPQLWHQCKFCGYRALRKDRMVAHSYVCKSNNQPKTYPFKCEICSKKFTLKQYLQTHKKRHDNRLPLPRF